MSIGVFSNFQNMHPAAVQGQNVNSRPAFDSQNKEDLPDKKQKFINTAKTVLPYAIPLAAIPVTAVITYKLSNKNLSNLKSEIGLILIFSVFEMTNLLAL